MKKPSLCASSTLSSSSSVIGKTQTILTVPFLNYWPQYQNTCMKEWLCSSTKFCHGWLHSNRSLDLLEKKEVHEWRKRWGRCFKPSDGSSFLFNSLYILTHVAFPASPAPVQPTLHQSLPPALFFPSIQDAHHLKNFCSVSKTKLTAAPPPGSFLRIPCLCAAAAAAAEICACPYGNIYHLSIFSMRLWPLKHLCLSPIHTWNIFTLTSYLFNK